MFFPAIKGSVAKFYKIKESQIDGPVFNVHCKITAILLFLGSTIITTQMNVGKPIQCISDVKNEDREKVINTFCWVNSTFRLVPDLSPYDDSGSYPRDHGPSRETYYNYYQWVGFILFFQAIIFYSPKWLWKLCEGKLMATLLATGSRKYEEGEARKKKAQSLTNYFTDRLKRHRSYAITYWLMEFLCLCNVILQTIMIDKFLGGNGQFLSYGSKFSFSKLNLAGTVETLNGGGIAMKKFNELDYIFPLQTKCNFRYFGASGSPQLVDALCILFLNIYNRCIFAIMWYWFSLLLLLLTSLLIYRLALIFSPSLRVLLLRTPGKRDLDRETKAVVNQLPVTDWWVLYMLKQNIDVNLFKDLISELFHDLQMSKKMRDSDE